MKLTQVRITEFQSILDSTEFEVGDVTCLVGKNEAGKTALLKALYRLNPVVVSDGKFDPTDDYPRHLVGDYEDDIAAGKRDPSIVVRATYTLESSDIQAVRDVFGTKCLQDEDPSLTLEKGYSNKITLAGLRVCDKEILEHLISSSQLTKPLDEKIKGKSINEKEKIILASRAAPLREIQSMIRDISKHGGEQVVFDRVLQNRIPKFLYFDEYYQMKGEDNLNKLLQRVKQNILKESDHPLLGLIGLAGLDLKQLLAPRRTERLLARLEAAENQLTRRVLVYWSQNRHLRMQFDIRKAQPEDGLGMTQGMNIWGRVEDTKHMVTTPLGTRSRGFVWFFSFLAWYSTLKKKGTNLILLLDEPGLSLHAKAQEDLLRYFEKELKPHHQLIYTTHSPFMIAPEHFDRVRIVQDRSIEADSDDLPEAQQGTKVITEVLEATSDSLFPLQGALGYEIHQTLFIGPSCLVVEGVSDLLYIQTMSAFLQRLGRPGLNSDWTITPVGGAGNVPTFVALIGARTRLNIAVLMDFHQKDRQTIENLYKSKLLRKKQVMTFADFTCGSEADIEDMFDSEFYVDLVKGEFETSLQLSELSASHPRILYRLEKHLEKYPLPKKMQFNHYRPARYFSENVSSLGAKLSQETLDRFQRAFDALNKLL